MNRISAQSSLKGRRRICRDAGASVIIALLLLAQGATSAESRNGGSPPAISQAASAKCAMKFKEVEEFGKSPDPQKEKTTQFSQDEINSYLALELQPKFGQSLKVLQMQFKENSLQVAADIDFDSFGDKSAKLPERLLAATMTGVHKLTAAGRLHAKGGEAYFELLEARIDDNILPNFLVEEIISAVGRRQKPPFDPLQPSQMPYHIKSVDMHAGMIIVHQ
jgi:hypothetical protein